MPYLVDVFVLPIVFREFAWLIRLSRVTALQLLRRPRLVLEVVHVLVGAKGQLVTDLIDCYRTANVVLATRLGRPRL